MLLRAPSASYRILHPSTRTLLRLLLEELFGLVDLCSEVRATSAIGMVEKHDSTVRLADLVLCEGALAADRVSLPRFVDAIVRSKLT